jgi:hypothetical protein
MIFNRIYIFSKYAYLFIYLLLYRYSKKCGSMSRGLIRCLLILRKHINSIHRPSLFNILKEFNIPKKLISLIKTTIENSEI